MKFDISFHNKERTVATIMACPSWWERLLSGEKSRSALVERHPWATWEWRFSIDHESCPMDMGEALEDARRWQRLEGLPGARVVKS